MRTQVAAVAIVVIAGVLSAGQDSASATSGWEFEFAVGVGQPDSSVSYEHELAPIFRYQPDASGSLQQELAVESEDGFIWRFGVRRMFGPRFGLQSMFGRGKSQLTGTSSPLQVDLRFTQRFPPNYEPKQLTYSGSTRLSDVEGESRLDYLCLNVLARARREKRVQLEVSGGVTVFGLETDLAPVGAEVFWLGGHGVLGREVYQMAVTSSYESSIGVNLGVGVDVPAGKRFRVFGEARGFLSPSIDLELEPTARIDTVIVWGNVELDEFGAFNSLEFDPSFISLAAGVRVGF